MDEDETRQALADNHQRVYDEEEEVRRKARELDEQTKERFDLYSRISLREKLGKHLYAYVYSLPVEIVHSAQDTSAALYQKDRLTTVSVYLTPEDHCGIITQEFMEDLPWLELAKQYREAEPFLVSTDDYYMTWQLEKHIGRIWRNLKSVHSAKSTHSSPRPPGDESIHKTQKTAFVTPKAPAKEANNEEDLEEDDAVQPDETEMEEAHERKSNKKKKEKKISKKRIKFFDEEDQASKAIEALNKEKLIDIQDGSMQYLVPYIIQKIGYCTVAMANKLRNCLVGKRRKHMKKDLEFIFGEGFSPKTVRRYEPEKGEDLNNVYYLAWSDDKDNKKIETNHPERQKYVLDVSMRYLSYAKLFFSPQDADGIGTQLFNSPVIKSTKARTYKPGNAPFVLFGMQLRSCIARELRLHYESNTSRDFFEYLFDQETNWLDSKVMKVVKDLGKKRTSLISTMMVHLDTDTLLTSVKLPSLEFYNYWREAGKPSRDDLYACMAAGIRNNMTITKEQRYLNTLKQM